MFLAEDRGPERVKAFTPRGPGSENRFFPAQGQGRERETQTRSYWLCLLVAFAGVIFKTALDRGEEDPEPLCPAPPIPCTRMKGAF